MSSTTLWLSACALLCLASCTTFNDLTASASSGQTATCRNGVRDTGETGVDCGPACNNTCDGDKCTVDTTCASGKCSAGTCAASAGKKCGIGLPNACNDGDTCGVDADCTSDYCDAKCTAPSADVHSDGRRNGGETGVDCGGGTAPACGAGQACKTNDDCQGVCQSDGTCAAPSPTDGKKDGDESDVDCGGTAAPKCVLDKVCGANADCELDACTTGKCVTPTSSDGIQNGGETDIDCGGAGVTGSGVTYQAPRCTVDKTCGAGTDCLTGACSPGKKCSLPSCATAETAGITTCGQGETGQAGAAHESCCISPVLPTTTTRRLDKYEITTGRFRAFISAVGPNLRAWAAQYATDHPSSQLATLLATYPVVKGIFPEADLGADLSLTAHLSFDIDNYSGVRGCFNGTGNYSANTYWQDDKHQKEFGLPPRTLPRTTSDEKSMNCVQPLLFTAFCAWDGGELATAADYANVWPASQSFPWGNTNYCTEGGGAGKPGDYKPCNSYNWCNGPNGTGGFTCQNTSTYTAASTNLDEDGMFYEFPKGTDRSTDNEVLIAAPGRFPKDLSAAKSADGQGWYDLFANLGEYTGDFVPPADPNAVLGTFCDMSSDPAPGASTCTRTDRDGQTGTLFSGIPQAGMVGSTWEGHQYGAFTARALPVTFQYGKFGARCARPAAAY